MHIFELEQKKIKKVKNKTGDVAKVFEMLKCKVLVLMRRLELIKKNVYDCIMTWGRTDLTYKQINDYYLYY